MNDKGRGSSISRGNIHVGHVWGINEPDPLSCSLSMSVTDIRYQTGKIEDNINEVENALK